MALARTLLTKLGQLLVVILLVTLFSALLLELLPGDPVTTLVPYGSEEQREAIRADLNLDDPFMVRYGRWLGDLAQGDLGNYYSVSAGQPVADRLWEALPKSLQLMVYAQLIGLLFAIPLGVLTAYRNGTFFDRMSSGAAFAMLAIPNFALGFILQYYLGVKLGWFAVSGYTPVSESVSEHFRTMFLPSITLAVGQIAVYMRLLRTDMIATLQQDFILMAKAKGLKVGVGKFPWAASGRAIGIGRTEGFTKLVFDEATHRVIGGGIVGVHAGDLISELALAIEMGAEAADIAHTIHPHPTLGETVAMAAEVFEGTITDLYIPKKK